MINPMTIIHISDTSCQLKFESLFSATHFDSATEARELLFWLYSSLPEKVWEELLNQLGLTTEQRQKLQDRLFSEE